MIEDAIEYPLEGDDAITTLVIGGALYFLASVVVFFGVALTVTGVLAIIGVPILLVAVVPYLLLWGYSVAVSRAVMDGRPAPPAFEEWGQYARDGVYVLAIFIIYGLPLAVLGVLGLVVVGVALVLPEEVAAVIVVLGALVGGLVVAVYSVAYYYALPAALVNYARTGRLAAAWDVDTLRAVLTNRDYAVAWAIAAVVLLVGNSAGNSLTFVLVGFAVLFYTQVAVTFLVTRGVVAALDVAPAEDVAEAPAAVTDAADVSAAADAGDVSAAADAGDDASEAADAGEEAGRAAEPGRGLEDVRGVGAAKAEALRAAGYETVADLRAATADDLAEVEGIGPALADRIKEDVGDE